MEIEEIKNLIRFHQAGLDQYRQHMSPAAQYGEEQTIKALKELEASMKLTSTVEEAKKIIREKRGKTVE